MNNNIETTKVSVVIPVYNTEKYLEEALESIIGQTLKEIEIIVVNDGSTDSSSKIIDRCQKKDTRIKVFNQNNKGQSSARNRGLEASKGKYIYFFDSDDILERETLEVCYKLSEENDLDILTFNGINFVSDVKMITNEYAYIRKKTPSTIMTGKEYLKIVLKNNEYSASVCLNFINLEFLKKIELKFFEGIIHEDELFIPLLYSEASKILHINNTFFRRRYRANSTMTSKKSIKNTEGLLIVMRELKHKLEIDLSLGKKIVLRVLESAVSISLEIGDKKSLDKIKKDFKNELGIKNWIKIIFPFLLEIKKKIRRA